MSKEIKWIINATKKYLLDSYDEWVDEKKPSKKEQNYVHKFLEHMENKLVSMELKEDES